MIYLTGIFGPIEISSTYHVTLNLQGHIVGVLSTNLDGDDGYVGLHQEQGVISFRACSAPAQNCTNLITVVLICKICYVL